MNIKINKRLTKGIKKISFISYLTKKISLEFQVINCDN